MQKHLRPIYQQLIKFSITGVINTCIDFSLFNLLLIVSGAVNPWQIGLINVISVGAAATNSYLMNQHWTFRGSSKETKILRFLLASITGILINTLVVTGVGYLTDRLPIPTYVLLNSGKLLGALLGSTWNFVIYRTWVFTGERRRHLQPAFTTAVEPGLTSIIIPAYNEASRLPARLLQLQPLLADEKVELVIVDDGSTDDTRARAEEFALKHRGLISVISHMVNQGKGAAVNSGMAAARGEYLLFSDADSTFSAAHLMQIKQQLQCGHDVVIGCRTRPDGSRLVGESRLRQVIGRGFNILVQALVLPGITDSQCGLKGFSRSAALALFSRQFLTGFAFDVEILALARRLGFTIKVLNVEAAECEGSSVKCWQAALNMGLDLLRIRWNFYRNYYGLPRPAERFSWSLAGGIFAAALAVRIPWLWEVPRYIDELSEVYLAYLIYQGKVFPLTNMAHDIGSMHNYILAGIFKLLGPSIYWPRLYIAVTSALTVVIVYELGRRLFGRMVGLLTAGLLLANGMHIMVTHMAWSNSSTPFFYTLALLTLLVAEEKKSGIWLVGSAILWAACLQTHSSVIIYVLAAAFYVLRPQFRQQITVSWRLAGLSIFLAGYANMIIYNLISRGGSLLWVGKKTYTLENDPGLISYMHNTVQMGVELLRSLGSIYTNPSSWDIWWPYPWLITVLAVLIIGLLKGYKSGKILPAYMILASFLVIPWLNQRYTFYLATRYIMPTIICAQIFLAAGMVELGHQMPALLEKVHQRVRSVIPGWLNLPPSTASINTVSNWLLGGFRQPIITWSLVLSLLSLQLFPFYRMCDRSTTTNESNRMALNVLRIIAEAGSARSVVVLDESLPIDNKPMPYLLKLSRQPFIQFNSRYSEINWVELRKKYPRSTIYAVVSAQAYNRLRPLAASTQVHRLQTQVNIPRPSQEPRRIYVLRLTTSSSN
ncbi:MAG: glycosyltransferase [Methylocystaceae bacterium]